MTSTWLGLALLAATAAAGPGATAKPDETQGNELGYETLRYRDRIEKDGRRTRTIEARIFLPTTTAVQAAGQLVSPYVDGLGSVEFQSVVVAKPDGRRIDVTKTPVEDVNPFGLTGTSIAADIRFKRLTVPGLEAGDRLSYRIVIQQKPLTAGHCFGEMKFSPAPGDPEQSYELDLPRDAGLNVRLREGLGASWEEVASPKGRLVRRLRLTVEQPDLDGETFTDEVLEQWIEPDVMFTSFASWEEVGRWWWGLSREHLEPDATVKGEARALAESLETPRERIEALHRFVGTSVRYLNVSFGLGRMQPRPAPKILADLYGDCKDKHALLAALGASVDVDVRPVLVNSRRTHLRNDVPGPHQFDHMISVVRFGPEPDDWLWLDSTNPFGPPGYLAPSLRDKDVLLIERSGKGLIVRTPADPPFDPITRVDVDGTLETDGSLRARVTWQFRSDKGVQLRAAYGSLRSDLLPGVVEAGFATDWEDAEVSNVSVSNASDTAGPFRIAFDVEQAPRSGTGRKDRRLWVPLPEMGLPETDPKSAVDLEPSTYTVTAEIELAEGLDVRPPLSVSLDRPFGSYESIYSVEGRRLRIERTLDLSMSSVPEKEKDSYRAFRRAIERDRDQEFAIHGDFPQGVVATPQSLHSEGWAAFNQRDYARAIELLREAVDGDPTIENGYQRLGRALHEADRSEEAIEAFSRQLERDSFHEFAYAWRGFLLEQLGRWDEAEKDFLQQIEVAPFEVWSYERLAERRTKEGRIAEAADLYERAAAIEPDKPVRWLDLGLTQVVNGQPAKARIALDHARALDMPDSMTVTASVAYGQLGDFEVASELAARALPLVAEKLATLSPESYGEKDLRLVKRLADLWFLVGMGAFDTDAAKAADYLEAAWRLVFDPRAGWALGELREKQGRLSEAFELWSMAASVGGASSRLPADRQQRIEAASRRLAGGSGAEDLQKGTPAASTMGKPARQILAEDGVMELRTVRLDGEALVGLSGKVLLLVDTEGRIQHIKAIAPEDAAGIEDQLASAGASRMMALPKPDDMVYRAVKRGLLACTRGLACVVYLDLPIHQSDAKSFGSIEIVDIELAGGSTLERGQRVPIVVTVRYDLQEADHGSVRVFVQDQADSLHDDSPKVLVERGTGEAELKIEVLIPQDSQYIDVLVALMGVRGGRSKSVARRRYDLK